VTLPAADDVADLAPTGLLRASINLGNPVLAQGTPDAPSGSACPCGLSASTQHASPSTR
jgi:polar amino acid transport system substrate-binding protein